MKQTSFSKTNYSQIIDNAPVIIWESHFHVPSKTLTPKYVNTKLKYFTGYSPQEWISTPQFFENILHPQDLSNTLSVFSKLNQYKHPRVIHQRWIKKNSQVIWTETNLTYFQVMEPDTFGIRGYTFDITNRIYTKQALNFLLKANHILSASFDYHQNIAKIAVLAIKQNIGDVCSIDILSDNNQIISFAFAYKNKDLESKISNLRRQHPVQYTDDYGVGKVIRTGQEIYLPVITQSFLDQFDEVMAKTIKEIKLNSLLSVPIIINGKIFGALTTATTNIYRDYSLFDLKTIKELSRFIALSIESSDLYAEATNAIKIRDQFISLASHELKTPLTSLSLHLQLLKHKLSNPDPAVSQHVTKIQDQVNKLTNLVKDLLTISRIESGKINYNFETFNLVELVQNILSSFPKDSHRLKFTFNPVPMYYGDPERITQAIFNLISNALKYSPDNSTVNVNLVKDGEHDIAISIKDRGPGIQKENHEKIFERFFQIKDTQINRTYPGLGIGLFTARQIARSHGGDISLVSDTGQGSVFTLNLPLIQS